MGCCCHSKPIRKFSPVEESSPRQQRQRSPVELVYVKSGRAGSPTLSVIRRASRSSVSTLESNSLSNDAPTVAATILLPSQSLTDIHTQCISEPSTIVIDDNKILFLLEKLVDYAYKWKEIGIALGFPLNELQVIEAKPSLHFGAPNSWLTEMLSRWVQWTPETQHGKYATLEDLVKALKSKTVGLAAVAEEIKKAVAETHSTSNLSQPQQGSSTCGQIDRSKLSRHKPLTRNDSEILAIEFELIPPDPSASPLDHYAFYLRSCFTYSREPADKWPQIEAREYIHLAVVSNEYYNRQDLEEFRKATLHGSIDDILKSKAPIDFSDLLKPNHVKGKRYAIRRILLEGAPGIGKSTISWEICRKWGNGELFQEYSLVVLIRFRDPWVQKVNSVSDLFCFPGEPEIQSEVAKQIKRTQGKGLLLILEGFDEAPPALRRTDSLFFQLFKCSLLPNATVMVTTRPSASYDLQRCCKGESSRRIEVLGFGKKEINEYIESVFIESTLEEKEDFYKYLELYPHIYSMMYVPLNSAIVTHVYQSCKSSSTIVPKTMTQLYTALVKTMLLRYMKEFQEYESIEIDNFNDLPGTILEKFREVCKLAYQGITKPETQIIFSGLRKDFDSLGLMQSVPELYIDKGASVSYNFLHLTIQEYLAAYHLSQLSEGEQVTFSEKNIAYNEQVNFSVSREMPLLLRFLAGLSPSRVCKFLARKYVSTDHDLEQSVIISKAELHLFFELHDPHALGSILLSLQTISFNYDNHYAITNNAKYYNIFHLVQLYDDWISGQLPFDCYVLGYCISSSHCQWKISIETEHLEIFTKGMTAFQQNSGPGSGVTHIISGNQSNSPNVMHVASLAALFEANTSFTLFDIEGLTIIDISNDTLNHLVEVMKANTTLQVLSLSSVTFRLLKQNESAAIEHGDFSNPTVSTLCSMLLKTENHLVKLLLVSCGLKKDDAIILCEALKVNSRVQFLNISQNEIGDEGAAVLAKTLETNSTLDSLSLKGNHIGTKGAAVIAYMLTINSTLINLDLSGNQLKDEGVVALAKGLERNSTLESLSLKENQFGNEGAATIVHILTVNSSLINLDLRCNKLDDEGVMMLLDSVRLHNMTMKMLKLQNPKSPFYDDKFESPSDCDRIQLSPSFCKRHPSIVHLEPQVFSSPNTNQTHTDSDSGTDYEDMG